MMSFKPTFSGDRGRMGEEGPCGGFGHVRVCAEPGETCEQCGAHRFCADGEREGGGRRGGHDPDRM